MRESIDSVVSNALKETTQQREHPKWVKQIKQQHTKSNCVSKFFIHFHDWAMVRAPGRVLHVIMLILCSQFDFLVDLLGFSMYSLRFGCMNKAGHDDDVS